MSIEKKSSRLSCGTSTECTGRWFSILAVEKCLEHICARALIILLVLMIPLMPQVAVAESQQCGDFYRVVKGDSLSRIAERVYGSPFAYQIIVDYNPGLVTDPNLILQGAELYLPCSEGTSGNELPDLPPDNEIDPKIRMVTGSDYHPYVGKKLLDGGFSVEVVKRALLRGSPKIYERDKVNYRVDLINDWDMMLQPLLSTTGYYHLSFPWFRPDCSVKELLSKNSIWRCENLYWSDPLHDVVVAFYARAKTAKKFFKAKKLEGLKICRPGGYFTHDLEAMGLTPSNYVRVKPDTPKDCFELLAAGKVDIATMNADTSDNIIRQLGIADKVVELTQLATVQSLHVVSMIEKKENKDKEDRESKNNREIIREARRSLLHINDGLEILHKEGIFRRIADKHLK